MSAEVDVPEGVYLVTVVYGADDIDSVTTMKAELRRVCEVNLRVPRGGSLRRTYRVSVHVPEIGDGRKVGLKSREVGTASWDGKLSLEFLGAAARVRSVTVEKDAGRPLCVRMLGDSTMTDSTSEPYYGWGQAFPALFDDGVVVDNHAESGLTLKSFEGSRRLAKVLALTVPGDFLFIQFGHNDQKEKGDGVGAFTSYAERLRQYVKAIREKGGRPVIVTSVARRRFDDQGKVFESLGDFPEAARRVAKELGVPLLDLNEASKKMYQAMGAEPSKAVFLHIPATAKKSAIADDTHFSSFGAFEVARCASSQFAEVLPELAKHLRPELAGFDPARPDARAAVAIPASRSQSVVKPDGN